MNVFIAGLGLIGGSYAKALKSAGHFVTAYDQSASTVKMACAVVDKISSKDTLCSDIKNADISIICLYPSATVDFIKNHAADFKKGSVVTDSCGVKQGIVETITKTALEYGFCFISSHPMAGKETSGFESSDKHLFEGASLLVIPNSCPPKKLHLLTDLAVQCGFSQIKQTTAEEHDTMIAYTSQLPHALACAYILNPNCLNHSGFSAGSFKDVSRVARINSRLWAELFCENKLALASEIGILIENLGILKELIEKDDRKTLERTLEEGRKMKEQLDK